MAQDIPNEGRAMTKQEQFLWIVQTVTLANNANLARLPEWQDKAHAFSASGTFILADDAVYASERIPERLSAAEAAHEFLSAALENWREPDTTWPTWCTRR